MRTILNLLPLFIAIISTFQTHAQCGITVDAGPDLFICNPGQGVNLMGQISGNYEGVQWTPSDLVISPNSPNTPAFPSGNSTTFTLTAFGSQPTTNLVVNGDFSNGATGFSSSYSPGSGGSFGLLSNEGEYAVASNSSDTHNNFASCGDNTGGGNMMVVNGSTAANQTIWCQSVSVQPNSGYAFSTFIATVEPTNPAILQFSINGQLLGNAFNASSSLCAWTEFTEVWNSGNMTSATICITNQNTAESGNDFAIDDIVFGPVCSESDEVTVSLLDIQAVINPPGQFPCNGGVNSITLNGTGSSVGPDIVYQWTTSDGSILSGANTLTPEISEPGTYTLNVSYPPGGANCAEQMTVTVTENTNMPTAVANAPDEINCNNNAVSISGIGSSEGAEYTYQWTTSNGNIISGATTLTPQVDMIGTYTLTVLNTMNNCSQVVDVTVTGNTTPPNVLIFPPEEITCSNGQVSLDATNSDSGPGFIFSWETFDGNFISGTNTLSPTVDMAGTYQLTIENTMTGCIESATVVVTGDNDMPIAVIEPTPPITCNQDAIFLNGNGSSQGGSYVYQWSTFDGNILSGENGLEPEIDAPGTYTLVVTNALNNCFETATITVGGDSTPPDAFITPPNELNCNTEEIMLNATGSSMGVNITYEWSTDDGNFVSGENTLVPSVDAPGTYTLLVVDNGTGCESIASVTVGGNNTPPQVLIFPPDEITCSSGQVSLDATSSDSGPGFIFSWETFDGNFISGTNTLSPTVDMVGTYQLTIENTMTGCIESATVVVTGDNDMPIAVIEPTPPITCNQDAIFLNGNGSSQGGPYFYQWSTFDGNILSGEDGLEPEIDAPGTYTLIVTNALNNCFETATITVEGNSTPPDAFIVPPNELNCNTEEIMLNATGSSMGVNITYEWSTDDGNFVNGENTLVPSVDAPGTYTLFVVDNGTGCESIASVTVGGNNQEPIIEFIDPDVLACGAEMLIIDATLSSSEDDFIYTWTTDDGSIVSGENTLLLEVEASGIYELTIENPNTGCSATDIIEVFGDTNTPVADAGEPMEFFCNTDFLFLNGNNSDSGNNIIYEWTTDDGNIVSGENGLEPEIDAAGTYTLTVSNIENNCFSIATVTIGGNTTPPIAAIAPPDELDCNNTAVFLDGTGSDAGDNITYEWTNADGGIVGGEFTETAEVDLPGEYTLIVTNIETGCEEITSVTVMGNIQEPTIEFIEPELLACGAAQLTIDASLSSTGNEFSYNWTTPNGNILSGENTLILDVDANGIYELTIENTDTGCSFTDEVEVFGDTNTPVAEAGEAMDFFCNTETLTLDGGNSDMGNTLVYEWSTDNGNIISDETTLNPTVDQPGTYILTITNLSNECVATDVVEIIENFTPPTADAGMEQSLTCVQNSLTLDGSNSDTGSDITYLWTTTDGNILDGNTSLAPTIDVVGTYELEVTNTFTGCVATSSVLITNDQVLPTAEVNGDTELTCTTQSLMLDATNSSAANNLSAVWTTNDGQIDGDANSLNINATTVGTYILTITDDMNGCTAMDTIFITENINPPTAAAGEMDTLNCIVNSLVLNGGASSTGDEFSYQWQTSNGNILMNENSLNPSIDQIGNYELTVTNMNNGCTATSMVEIIENVNNPNADAGQTATLTCVTPNLMLNGNNSDTGDEFSYQWQSQNGNIVMDANTLNPTIDAMGIYELTVTNTTNGCASSATVNIDQDITAPSADAGPTAELSCTTTEITLNGMGSDSGNTITYQWTTPNGNIIANADQTNPTINAAGDYLLEVTNTTNGCSSIANVNITQDDSTPTAAAGTAEDLTCLVESTSLDGGNSSMGNNFSYSWATDNGNIVAGETTLTPTIDAPGIYVITVLNQDNNCQSFSSVTVVENINTPTANAGMDMDLTCTTNSLSLDASASSSDNGFSYAWSSMDGNIISGASTANPVVDATGTYVVMLTDNLTGCTATDMVVVGEDENIPAVTAAVTEDLTCVIDSVLLNALGSDVGNNFTYQWTNPNGNIITNATTLEVFVSEVGMYELEITNTDNGCTNMTEVEVFQNITSPIANAGMNEILDCQTTSISLDGSASDQGGNFSYQWQTINGNISNGATTLSPSIDQAGTYELVVTNTENGCTASDDILIENDESAPSVAIAEAAVLTCSVETLVLDASASDSDDNLNLVWTTNNGNIQSDETTLTPTINQAGTYTLTLTNPDNGCEASTSITVLENTTIPSAEAGTAEVLNCNIPQISLNGSSDGTANLQYQWTSDNGQILSGTSTLNPVISAVGTYTLTVINSENDCMAMDAVIVTENNPTTFNFDVNLPNCVEPTGDISFLNVEGGVLPYVYSIDGGQTFGTTTNFTALETGSYNLIVQDANGCQLEETTFLPASADIQLSLETAVGIKLGESYPLNALVNIPTEDIATITWTPADSLSCSDCLNPIAAPTETTLYQIFLTDINGCTTQSNITLSVNREAAVYIPNAFSPDSSENDLFFINARTNSVKEVQSFLIFDRWGETVFEDYNFQVNDPAHGWDGMARGKRLNPSVFVYVAIVEMMDGRIELFKGDVTLVR